MINSQISERLKAEFRGPEIQEAKELLGSYRHGEPDRVLNTILDLAGGDIHRIRTLIVDANRDPRDVLSVHRSHKEKRQAQIFILLVIGVFALYGIVRWAGT